MPKWSARGWAAVILAVCVGVSYGMALITTALNNGPATPEGANLLNTLGGVLVGGVVGWLGGRASQDDDTPEK